MLGNWKYSLKVHIIAFSVTIINTMKFSSLGHRKVTVFPKVIALCVYLLKSVKKVQKGCQQTILKLIISVTYYLVVEPPKHNERNV